MASLRERPGRQPRRAAAGQHREHAVDLLADLPEERAEEILEGMEQEKAEDLRELLVHSEETAGALMTKYRFQFSEKMNFRRNPAPAISGVQDLSFEEEEI